MDTLEGIEIIKEGLKELQEMQEKVDDDPVYSNQLRVNIHATKMIATLGLWVADIDERLKRLEDSYL